MGSCLIISGHKDNKLDSEFDVELVKGKGCFGEADEGGVMLAKVGLY